MLVAARLLQFSGALILFGGALFFLYGLDASGPNRPLKRWPSCLLFVAAIAAVLGTLLWTMAETASFSEDPLDAFSPTALWEVVWGTRFGRACLLRISLLATALVILRSMAQTRRLWTVQSVLGAVIILTLGWTGHGGMNSGSSGLVHVAADVLHMLGAGAWIGALVALVIQSWIALRLSSAEETRGLLRSLDRFSALGIWVVLSITLSGIINSWFLVGWPHLEALWTTRYGIVLLVKLLLFVGMLILGAHHRYRAVPALNQSLRDDDQGKTPVAAGLRTSLLIETSLAILVLVAVSVLGTLEPPIAAD